jgi:hypothetical protein
MAQLKKVFRRRYSRSASSLPDLAPPAAPLHRLAELGEDARQCASAPTLLEPESASDSSSSSSSEEDSSSSDELVLTKEGAVEEAEKARVALARVVVCGDLASVSARLKWRALHKSALRRHQNARRVLELLEAAEEMQRKLADVEASRQRARSQKDKCHQTMVKWSAAHRLLKEELHEREIDGLRLRLQLDEAARR